MKYIFLALIAFTVPVGIAVSSNWTEIRPYVIGDPEIAEGHLLYFAGRG